MSKTKSLLLNKGFAPVLVLILLSVSLASAVYIATLFINNDKASSPTPDKSVATEQSTNAFQAANSGSEAVLKKIYKEDGPSDMNALAQAVSSTTECTEGVISGSTPAGSYKVSIYDGHGEQIKNCTDSTWRSQVSQLKSEGTSGNTSRGIDVAVAAEPTPGITGGCTFTNSSNGNGEYHSIDTTWGVGCKSVLTERSTVKTCSSTSARRSGGRYTPGTAGSDAAHPYVIVEGESVALPGYSCGLVDIAPGMYGGQSSHSCVCVKK